MILYSLVKPTYELYVTERPPTLGLNNEIGTRCYQVILIFEARS